MRSDIFQHELAKTSAVFGRKGDVRVAFRGDGAATDGKTIFLPELARGKEVDDEVAAVMRGYCDHEAGHVRHTNMPLVTTMYKAWMKEGRVFRKNLHNALEDIWLERRVMRDYPGSEKNLRATSRRCNKRALKMYEDPKQAKRLANPFVITPFAITWEGRIPYGGPECAELVAKLPEDIRSKLPGYVERALRCANSEEVIRLALAIEQELLDEAKAKDPLPEPEPVPEPDLEPEKDEDAKEEPGEGEGDGGKGEGDEPDDCAGEEGDEADGGGDDGAEDEGTVGHEASVDVDGLDEVPDMDEDEDGDEAGDREGHGGEASDEDGDEDGEGHGAGGEETEASDAEGDDEASGGGGDGGESEGEEDADGDIEAGDGEGGGSTGKGHEHDDPEGAGDATLATDDREAEDFLKRGDKVLDDFDAKAALDDALKGAGLLDKHSYRPWSTAGDKWNTRKSEDLYSLHMQKGTAADYEAIKTGLTGEINVLRRGLERALLAKTTRDWVGAKEDGRLDSRRFPAAFAGRSNVFKARADSVDTDTAVTFLIDLSGSMGKSRGSKGELAMHCAIALAEALERTPVKYEVLGFSQPEADGERPKDAPKKTTRLLARWERLHMWVFKPFEERLFESKGPMSRIMDCVGGNNCDGESLMLAYDRLRRRPEKRKVLFVLSDGAPCCISDVSGPFTLLNEHLKDTVRFIESQPDTHVVGLGIMTDAVRKFYGDHVVVNNLGQLGTTAMRTLTRLLLDNRVRGRG